MSFRQDLMKPPNLVSSIRILIAPVLLVLAILGLETWFLAILIFSGFTDVVDGYLARRLNMVTPLGARLDSWGDFVIYSTMAAGAWILWPEITERELLYYSIILFSLLLPAQIGLIKFGKISGYHTWTVKVAVFITFVGYIALYAGIATWPFQLASLLSLIAGIEEILITLTLREARTDVRSLFAALRTRQRAD
jgi:cardiolipin synthase (CMP-forming)